MFVVFALTHGLVDQGVALCARGANDAICSLPASAGRCTPCSARRRIASTRSCSASSASGRSVVSTSGLRVALPVPIAPVLSADLPRRPDVSRSDFVPNGLLQAGNAHAEPEVPPSVGWAAMKVERGQQPPRMHLPAKVWKRPPRVASDLEPLGMYLLLPAEVPVYATTLLDGWYLVGEERSFSVAEDGTVTEHT